MIKYISEKRNLTQEAIDSEQKHIDMLNDALGDIVLTPAEEHSLQWLSGWETYTIKHIISAFNKAEKNRT